MSSFGSPSTFFLAGKKAYEVERSLRFNSADSANLTRTSSSTSTTFTYSAWIKRSKFSNYQYIFSIGGRGFAFHTSNNTFYLYDLSALNESTAVFRDPSAWYHIVVQINSGVATSYVNNVLVHNAVGSGFTLTTGANETRIGSYSASGGGYYFDGYQTEIHLVDGSVLAPSSFVETDAKTGQLIPKKYTGSYGTNGFYLNFSDNSGTTATTLGKDYSGNGNNFTPNNFSVSAGTGNDSFEDTPTNNFPTMNPLNRGPDNPTCSNGNLYWGGSTDHSIVATFAIPSSGKWYWEYTKTSGTYLMSGIIGDPETMSLGYFLGGQATAYTVYAYNGYKYNAGSGATYMATPSTSTTIMIAFDADTRKLYFGADGNWGDGSGNTNQTFGNAAVAYTVTDGITYYPAGSFNSGSAFANFGQRAFSYKPTGYKSLCSANLPDPTILLSNKHFDTTLYTGNGSNGHAITGLEFQPDWLWLKKRNSTGHHGIYDAIRSVNKRLLADENGAEADVELASFDSGGFTFGSNTYYNNNTDTYVAWSWNGGDTDGKTYAVTVVSDSGNKYRFDGFGTSAVTLDLAEGGTYIFDQSDSSNAGHPLRFSTTSNGTHGGGTEYTIGVTTAGTPGSSGAYTQIVVAASAPTLYYYCSVHSGMGGQVNTNSTLGSSNFDGSVQSTVKANATAGFSIVTYAGTGSDATIGHGLGVAPKVVNVKCRNDTHHWRVYFSGVTDTDGKYLSLDSTIALTSGSDKWNGAPTSSVFGVSGDNSTGGSLDYVAYCFSEVAGYSKFGSYTGNGSTNGVFVHLGFRAAFIIIKSTSLATSWNITTADIEGYNVVTKYLDANTNSAEGTYTFMDILSNGFKLRNVGSSFNNSGSTYVYFAFAESPFKNARAR